jgi:predicted transcriptional regulator
MKNTIMTEKISRRGVRTPDSYEPDVLEKIPVAEVMQPAGEIINKDHSIGEVLKWLKKSSKQVSPYLVVSDEKGEFKGLLKCTSLLNREYDLNTRIEKIVLRSSSTIFAAESLREAVEKMAAMKVEALPVTDDGNTITGIVSFESIMTAYRRNSSLHGKNQVISLKRRGLKVLVKGRNRWKGK